jgi:alkanesulfonate monooxygenase SsuD/methylene tetrahydromethanopterin reductase-like flavin-dependent oxidoreductase (luciferase family)
VSLEFFVFLPQMRLSFDDLVARARAAEAAGFAGLAGMDHLVPPLAAKQPMYEAMVTNTWLAAHTSTLRIGSLVLCDSFRHPAMLAREAVSIDHASGGRFELGIGWGSVPDELATFGIGSTEAKVRVARVRETLEVVRALWSGEEVSYEGTSFTITEGRQQPVPLGRIPIVIGGAGPKTLALVRDFADWWNLHVGLLDKIDELREHVGDAGVSIQEMAAFVPREEARDEVTALAKKRFGYSKPVIGSGAELVDHYGSLVERGVQRVYVWFTDFAPPATLEAFGAEVIAPLNA